MTAPDPRVEAVARLLWMSEATWGERFASLWNAKTSLVRARHVAFAARLLAVADEHDPLRNNVPAQRSCERCGKMWEHGDCATTVSRRALCTTTARAAADADSTPPVFGGSE